MVSKLESEFNCLSCGGPLERIKTKIKLTAPGGEALEVSNLVDFRCVNCGQLRPLGPLLPRVEQRLKGQNNPKNSD
ncbi:MAG: YgiT-type zinc finger protein [Patescibacteria group bacterium]|nr:YgiT-type zinc finger protein [Patescibacteria group bacterium]